jgi:hypothetical protein
LAKSSKPASSFIQWFISPTFRLAVVIMVLSTMFGLYPFLRAHFADGGYRGPQLQGALEGYTDPLLLKKAQYIYQSIEQLIINKKQIFADTIIVLTKSIFFLQNKSK